jgi:hypothetical protein
MPLIQFDPPNESPQKGGGSLIDKPLRDKYMSLTKQIFLPDAKPICDQMLEIIHQTARAYIDSLDERLGKDKLISGLEEIMQNIDPNETNYPALINVVALQVAALFTEFIMAMTEEERELYVGEKGVKNDRFLHGVNTDSASEAFFEKLQYYKWKKYDVMKNFIRDERSEDCDGTPLILNDQPHCNSKFIAFIGFLTIREIVDAMLNNLWYLGLSYELQYVDGNVHAPTAYFIHDIEHSKNDYGKYATPDIIELLNKFLNYVKSSQTPSIIYSVYLVLFLIFHEGGYDSKYFRNNNRAFITIRSHLLPDTTDLRFYLDNAIKYFTSKFQNINHFGIALPKDYRVPVPNKPTKLQEEKVTEYLDLAIDRYITCWEEFQKTQQGGKRLKSRRTRRHTRRTHHKRKHTYKKR